MLQKNEEKQNEDIDRSDVAPSKSFMRFRDKNFRPTQDYSDSLKRRRGFLAGQTEFVIEQKEQEPPVQRFRRLQSEVKELSEELAAAAKERTPLEQDIPPLEIEEELQLLQSQLKELLSREEYRPFLNPDFEDERTEHLRSDLSKKLLAEIEAIKASPPPSHKPPTPGTASGSGGMTYELYCTTGARGRHGDHELLRDLDARLSELEKLVGCNKYTQTPPRSDMVSVVEELDRKISLLDRSELDNVDQRLQMLLREMDTLKRSTEEASLNPVQEKKVNDMFEMMQQADLVVRQIPMVVSRLQTLKHVHDAGVSFIQTLRQLQAQQDGITNLLTSHSSLLSQMEHGFVENTKITQKNAETLNTRIDELTKKLHGTQ